MVLFVGLFEISVSKLLGGIHDRIIRFIELQSSDSPVNGNTKKVVPKYDEFRSYFCGFLKIWHLFRYRKIYTALFHMDFIANTRIHCCCCNECWYSRRLYANWWCLSQFRWGLNSWMLKINWSNQNNLKWSLNTSLLSSI